MNTPTPTPRTDAAWSATFDGQQMSAGQTARALRECSQQLETELAALTTEREVIQNANAHHAERRDAIARAESAEREAFDWKKIARYETARAERAEAELAAATEECKNVRLKWHAVMGTCAAKEDAIMEVDEELARLEAELEKVYALVTPVGFDLPGGIFETAQAVTELTAERDQLRAERTYNHECINRLASATGTLGENSEGVVDVVLSTIDQLRAEVERLRSDRDCEKRLRKDADELREDAIERAERAEAELATERARLADLVADLSDACITLESAEKDCDDYAMQNTAFKLMAVRNVFAAMKEDAK